MTVTHNVAGNYVYEDEKLYCLLSYISEIKDLPTTSTTCACGTAFLDELMETLETPKL